MAVPAVAVSTVYTPVSAAQMVEWLTEVGFDEEQHRAEMVTALREDGYHLPRAWARPVRQEIIDVGIGAGYVSGVIERFQQAMVGLCGAGFKDQHRRCKGDAGLKARS